MDMVKKVLAWIGLACMACFLVFVLLLIFTADQKWSAPMFSALGAFLVAGGGAVVIKKLQERAEKERAKQQTEKGD